MKNPVRIDYQSLAGFIGAQNRTTDIAFQYFQIYFNFTDNLRFILECISFELLPGQEKVRFLHVKLHVKFILRNFAV